MTSGSTLTFDWNAAAADSLTTTAIVNTTGGDIIGIAINGTNTPTGGRYDVISSNHGASTLDNAT
ncbi:MAG: hypothetical protein K8R23_17090 [Chthoniobacter sp.]|nr:hypothetical protein [Chthoniobacter sp.]